jgi:anion-transporting  ArsA/GET3 family ATPase
LKSSKPSLFLSDSLKRKVIFFTGKGGVGKTTLAWSTAIALSNHGQKVRLVSWSPFDEESISQNLSEFKIPWESLEATSCFKEYTLKTLKFEKVFDVIFENKILKAFIEVAPGLSETVIAGKVWDLYDRNEQDTLIVDLPSTGHALSFFKSPMGIEKMFATGFVHRQAAQICDMFISSDTRLDLVTLPEEMPILENKQFLEKLTELEKFPLGFLHVNQCTPDFPLPSLSPKLLPKEIEECLWDHTLRKQREERALQKAAELPLTLKKIPRLTSEQLKDTVKQLAAQLEN